MPVDAGTFQSRIGQVIATFEPYAGIPTEANQIRVALGADATTRDTTLQTAPAGLEPGNRAQSPFTNAMLLEVNKGKGGNLSTVTMANIIGGMVTSPPVNTVAPQITYVSGGAGPGTVGGQYAGSAGTWNPTGTRANQWLRDGQPIAGATTASYTIAAADEGHSVSCRVTMSNSAGANSAVSNAVAIA